MTLENNENTEKSLEKGEQKEIFQTGYRLISQNIPWLSKNSIRVHRKMLFPNDGILGKIKQSKQQIIVFVDQTTQKYFFEKEMFS